VARKTITLYDTTLRDGAQCVDVDLSAQDKIKIALKLDALGIPYIEGGWPGANPVDDAFFREIAGYDLKHARVCAFGSTHHPSHNADNDPNLAALATSGVSVCTIFGKSWDRHVREALRIELPRNLEIIRDSVSFLCRHCGEVFFDAEHFFDGYTSDSAYATACLEAALDGGAQALVLCDTNGGRLPSEISHIVTAVKKKLPGATLGIHAHNDCELAVANSLAAVQAGARHVQGTVNGYGERCGNANLCSLIPLLEVKSGARFRCLPSGGLAELTATASYVAEVVNMPLFNRQPFVGRSAFAHKGGMHVSAVNRSSSLYEHITPETVGNGQRILTTGLSGRGNIVALARRFGFHLDKDEPVVKGLFAELKKKAALGYDYASAEASLELLVMRKLGRRGVREFFRLLQYHVTEVRREHDDEPASEATVVVDVEGVSEHTAASGNGPVNALDNALRKALTPFYPRLREMRLLDFKVRVLAAEDGNGGTAAVVRVLIESGDTAQNWVTVGVSHDIIEASWQALADSVIYKLYRDEYVKRSGLPE
jgi:2-isopropylmalate synthase